jgi:hypothetical protein
MMRRLVVLDVLAGPAWRDVSTMSEHLTLGERGGWLMIEPDGVRVVAGPDDGAQTLLDLHQGGPSFCCRVWHTTGGPDRPTIHTVAAGDADLFEEVLISVGFRSAQPQGIELQKDESGIYWGYYA